MGKLLLPQMLVPPLWLAPPIPINIRCHKVPYIVSSYPSPPRQTSSPGYSIPCPKAKQPRPPSPPSCIEFLLCTLGILLQILEATKEAVSLPYLIVIHISRTLKISIASFFMITQRVIFVFRQKS